MTWPKMYHMHSSEFYHWDTVAIKVCNHFSAPIDHRPYHDIELHPGCVPQCELQPSEVFADMFLLPSGPGPHTKGVGMSVKITLEHVYISSKIVTNVFPPTLHWA